jgi:predicted aspartyl protease
MISRAAVMAALVLALLAGVARADGDPAALPAGIVPTTLTLRALLTRHAVALGRPSADVTHEQWSYARGGLTGTRTFLRLGDDYREDITVGPFHSAYGETAGHQWEQDRSGIVRAISGIHHRDDVNTYAFEHPFLKASAVTLLGEVQAPLHAYVVRVAPASGTTQYLFFDASTFMIARDERVTDGERVVRTYDDFRPVAGELRPWHVVIDNGLPNDGEDERLQSFGTDSVQPAALAMPASVNPLTMALSRVRLPASISGDRVILTAEIGGRKVNFWMDSGSSGILLNRDVADATGVKSFGTSTAITAGEYSTSDAQIARLDLDMAYLSNVAGKTAPFEAVSYGDVPVAGLLGYELFAGAVIHVDYEHGTVEAVSPAAFTPPAGAASLPVRLDDGVPVISITIGAAQAKNVVVDTGADRSMIFSSFAAAHPDDIPTQHIGEEGMASLPFFGSISGVGGTVQTRQVRLPQFQVATFKLSDWPFEVSQNAASFEGDDYDGLLGQDFLRYFDVYFDYPQQMLYLVPNARYHQRWG